MIHLLINLSSTQNKLTKQRILFMNKNIKNLNTPNLKYTSTSPPPPPTYTELNSLSKTPKRKSTSSSSAFHSLFYSLFRPLLVSFFIATFFTLFFSCDCAVETNTTPTRDPDNADSKVDSTPPQIISSFPQPNTVGVPFSLSFEINIDFDQKVSFNQTNNLDFTLIPTSQTEEPDDTQIFNHADTRLSLRDSRLTLKLTNLLLGTTEYTFTIPQNALIKENDANHIIGNDEYTLTFTTAEKPNIDISLFSISTNTWYETQSTDDGSFNQTITIGFPTGDPTTIGHNDSLTGIFDTDLTDQIGNTTTPVTLSSLPNGLILRISKQATGIQLQLTGNATTHQKIIDNTTFSLTLLSDFFTFSADYNPSDITFSFDFIFGSPHWSKREEHQAFVYDDKIWITGGTPDKSVLVVKDDIWYSDDLGVNWTEVSLATGTTKWPARFAHQSFVYDEKIWILSGKYNNTAHSRYDIWTSGDDKGTNWIEIFPANDTSEFLELYDFQSFVYDDKIWVLGGWDDNTDNLINDIWTTTDGGTNWTKIPLASGTTKWSARFEHQSFVYDDKIWVLGGWDADNNRENDIWISDDKGTNWTEIPLASGTTKWSGRREHQSFVYDDKIWVLGGIDAGNNNKNDIWTSTDGGTNWSHIPLASGTTKWSARGHHQSFGYDDKIWVLGGYDNNSSKNDIWTSSDGGATWEEVIPSFY